VTERETEHARDPGSSAASLGVGPQYAAQRAGSRTRFSSLSFSPVAFPPVRVLSLYFPRRLARAPSDYLHARSVFLALLRTDVTYVRRARVHRSVCTQVQTHPATGSSLLSFFFCYARLFLRSRVNSECAYACVYTRVSRSFFLSLYARLLLARERPTADRYAEDTSRHAESINGLYSLVVRLVVRAFQRGTRAPE